MGIDLNIPVIETDRLILRGPRFSDLPVWTAFLASDRSEFVGGPQPDEGKSWRAFGHLAGMWALRGLGSFVFAHKDTPDQPLGHTGPWYPVGWPEPELGWCMWDQSAEGKGLVTEAATAARRFAYDTLGWDQPVSYIDPKNTRSIALAERLGCALDPQAKTPFPEERVLVYRHPKVLP